jgi:hypothetical protein
MLNWGVVLAPTRGLGKLFSTHRIGLPTRIGGRIIPSGSKRCGEIFRFQTRKLVPESSVGIGTV